MTLLMPPIFEPPKAISLWSDRGDHAGFMLLGINDINSSGPTNGMCVFMLTPCSAEGIESELGIIVSELKVGGEHCCSMTLSETGYEIVVHPIGLPVIIFTFDNEGNGKVVTEYNGEIKFVGTAESMNKKA
jgi:hypothetical protein